MDTDGTDNDVKFKIEADANNVTCETQLSRTFSDDWRKNKLETWLRSDFGSCKDKLYKVQDALTFSIIKTGKDNLKVRSSTFYMKRLDTGKTAKYNCGAFELKGNCNNLPCIKKFTNCTPSIVGGGTGATRSKPKTGSVASLIKKFDKKPTTTKATTTTTTTTTVAPTTKGKSFLSKLAGKLG